MIIHCNNGNKLDCWYDRQTRSSVLQVMDPEGNQIGEADYSGNRISADHMKAFRLRENGGRVKSPKSKSKSHHRVTRIQCQ